jgi:hypothetical protein
MSVFWRFLLGLSLALACAASGRGQTAERVTFAGDRVTLQGWLYAPATPGPHPAVVALHGCAGLEGSDGKPGARHDDWGQRLSAEGALALFPETVSDRAVSGRNAAMTSVKSDRAGSASPTLKRRFAFSSHGPMSIRKPSPCSAGRTTGRRRSTQSSRNTRRRASTSRGRSPSIPAAVCLWSTAGSLAAAAAADRRGGRLDACCALPTARRRSEGSRRERRHCRLRERLSRFRSSQSAGS